MRERRARTMMRRRWSCARPGFTLIEVLIAITMTALIAGIMGAAIRLGTRSLASADRKADFLQRYRTSLDVIASQLESEIPMLYDSGQKAKRFFFSGDRSDVQFASNYSIWRGTKGYVIVRYSVSKDGDGKSVLAARERIPGVDREQETTLLSGLDDLRFEYFSRSNQVPQGAWQDRWTDQTSMPETVRLQIARGRNSATILMPLYARGSADWVGWNGGAR